MTDDLRCVFVPSGAVPPGEVGYHPDRLRIPAMLIPHGAPDPIEWMAEHPGWIRIPATYVPRDAETAATAAITVAVGEEVLAGAGEAPSWMTAAARMAASAARLAAIGFGEIAAPLAGAGAAVLFFYPSRTVSEEQEREVMRQGLAEKAAAGGGLVPPEPLPPLPGLEVPDHDAKPGEGGFSQDSGGQHQEGFTATGAAPLVLAGPPAEPAAPIIVEVGRNEGLTGGLRTTSRRARAAARQSDPTVTQALKDADWEAHHLINMEAVRNARDLLAEAARAGWKTDDIGNVAAVPATPEAQQRLSDAGIDAAYQKGPHPKWNREVREALDDIRRSLQKEGLRPGSDLFAVRARKALETLQRSLREKLPRLRKLGYGPAPSTPTFA